MDINQLKSFVTVAHQGNLTQAAERLFLSQPAVSAQIKAIENDLGTPLFNRTSNGMTLTRAGEVLLPEAEALLQHKHKLEQFAKTLAQDFTEETQLGIIHPIDSTKLANLTALINQNAPNTRRQTHGPGAIPGQAEALGGGNVDTKWQGTLPKSGKYLIQVYQMRATARKGAKVPHSLSVGIQ